MNLDGFLQFCQTVVHTFHNHTVLILQSQLSFNKCPNTSDVSSIEILTALTVSGLNVQVPRNYFLYYIFPNLRACTKTTAFPDGPVTHILRGSHAEQCPRSDFHGVFATAVCQWSRILATIRSISVSVDLKSRPLIHAVDNRRG